METQRYIAFLRAINVGGHIVKMERLRDLFSALDFNNVATFISSGNVVFDTPERAPRALEQRIEAHLHAELGYAVATFLRAPTELAAIVSDLPFAVNEGEALSVGFLHAPPASDAEARLLALETDIDTFAVRGREVYWLCRTKVSESKITLVRLEKALGMPATFRNITTVRKLAAKYAS